MLDISGFGLIVNLIGSITLPVGATITQFADDADPMDIASVKFADTALGLNGDLLAWRKAVTLPMVLNVIPGSIDDITLGILADANRAAQGKSVAGDIITATIIYPDGSIAQYQGGIITDAVFGKAVASSGRLKTKPYGFSFQNKAGG